MICKSVQKMGQNKLLIMVDFLHQKALRTILSYIPCREDKQKSRLEADIKPVVDAIIIKCTDGNRWEEWCLEFSRGLLLMVCEDWVGYIVFSLTGELVSCLCRPLWSLPKEAVGSWVWEVRSQVKLTDIAHGLIRTQPLSWNTRNIQLSNLEKLLIGLANGSIFKYLTNLELLLNLYISFLNNKLEMPKG